MAGDSMTSFAQERFPLIVNEFPPPCHPQTDDNIQESASISYSAESRNGPQTQPTELDANSEQTGITDFGFGLAFVLIHMHLQNSYLSGRSNEPFFTSKTRPSCHSEEMPNVPPKGEESFIAPFSQPSLPSLSSPRHHFCQPEVTQTH
ncbi:hypothetical protein FRC03_001282 [Tulasnella sp. 419]|nr:hypothetical protein FRC03_001282 [Tulasnella sp. 419]